MPPPGTARLLLESNGGNIEPFLYVLLLWLVQRQPLIFGAVLAFGFLNREFTAYGLGALLLIEASSGSLTTKRGLQGKLLAAASAVAVFHVVGLLKSFGASAGPGTTVAFIVRRNNFGELAEQSCWALSGIPGWLTEMFTSQLGALFTGEMGWLWLILGTTMIAAMARIVQIAVRTGHLPWLTSQFPVYLTLVGLLAAVAHAVSRCGNIEILRYTLLALFGFVGVTALYMKLEANRRLKAALVAVVLLWSAINVAENTRYAFEHYASPIDPNLALADYLVSNDIRYAKSDYWTAYHVTFLSDENVIIASDYVRIQQYQDVVRLHDDEAFVITRSPCEGGHEVPPFYVCPPGS